MAVLRYERSKGRAVVAFCHALEAERANLHGHPVTLDPPLPGKGNDDRELLDRGWSTDGRRWYCPAHRHLCQEVRHA